MASTIGWELYRSFLGVMKEGSLSGAARALGVAQPTVGRHVAALERALGLPLFTRSQTGLAPTEAAQSLRGHVEAMESTASALERTAASQGDGVRGVVRVSASEVVAVEVLAPIVARLREKHPALTVELVASNRVQDLLRREADIAVRMTQPRQELLIARRIGHVDVGLHAHPRYLAAHGIRAGAGIGFCQVAIARREGLTRLLPRKFTLALDTWITMHEDLRNSPRCRVTFDALVEGMQQHIAAPLQ